MDKCFWRQFRAEANTPSSVRAANVGNGVGVVFMANFQRFQLETTLLIVPILDLFDLPRLLWGKLKSSPSVEGTIMQQKYPDLMAEKSMVILHISDDYQ
jgi:hypothetical protein